MKIHIVQKGDTLWKIAKKYGVNFEELKQMNAQLSNPDMIMPGMKIKVPTAGGTVKKETQIKYGSKEMPKKEMPKAEHPFKEQKPMAMPVEEPKKEMPKEVQKPFAPKMPKPVVPEIDINNYYMMNMANMQVQQPKQQAKPMPKPVSPPKPTNVLPKAKEQPKPKQEAVKGVQEEESLQMPAQPQGGNTQPMYYNPNNCVPVSPVMPGSGFCPPHGGMYPGAGYGMPMGPGSQVQGAQSMPGMQNMPMMPQMGYDEESSSVMPYMPHAQMPMQMPMQQPMQQPMQMPMQQPMGQPSGVMGVSDENYPSVQMPQQQAPYMPYPGNCYPVSPVMPGPGFQGGMPGGYPMGPGGQVQGMMSEESPSMGGYQMPMGQPSNVMGAQYQTPMGQPSNVMGASDQGDCGCGGPQYGQMMHQPMMQQYMPQGMQQPYGYGPGMMGQGMPGAGMPMGPQGQGMGMGMPMGPQGMPMGPQGMQMGSPGMFGPRAFAMPNFNDDDFEG
ncbi:SafA/ExsA family spore coat assembly protein [Bacillus sp. AFS015802]|uniref:SafA/ExsA family spore coat assembly protein n=1 Tax=Bacillus sp. AFS015802 TaxID=2033486 RepID=UPI00268A29C0|nr:SafA/ExsA family spore coat assembly protein [Bacillus sp. AFS015802]